ncbi:MAG: DUF2484 family protein [Silicimonas sp.]|nr:DUF2484 family protein [Silicimonas sp.]
MSLIALCLWVLIAAVVAMLPMRLQYPPGVLLLILVPFGLVWIAADHGLGYAGAGFLAFVSMFRNPLIYFWRRARGQIPEVPQ